MNLFKTLSILKFSVCLFYLTISFNVSNGQGTNDSLSDQPEAEEVASENQNVESRILCLLGAVDDEKLAAFCKKYGGVDLNWAEKAGQHYGETAEEIQTRRYSPLWRYSEERAKKSVFAYKVEDEMVTRVQFGRGFKGSLWRQSSRTSDLIDWESWSLEVNAPPYYCKLVNDFGYPKMKRKGNYISANLNRKGYHCEVTYWRATREDHPILTSIIVSLKDSSTAGLPRHPDLTYSTKEVVAYEDGCNEGNCQNGYGIFYDESTLTTYKGYYKNGKYHGSGEIWTGTVGQSFENTKVGYYKGDFHNGKPCGKGTLKFADGRKWVGGVMDWLPHGKGDMYPKGYEITRRGVSYNIYFIHGKNRSWDKPSGIDFNECDELKNSGKVGFSIPALEQLVGDIDQNKASIDALILEYQKLAIEQTTNLKQPARLTTLQLYSKELYEITQKMKPYSLDAYNVQLKHMMKYAECTGIDAQVWVDRLTIRLSGSQVHVYQMNATAGTVATQINATTDAKFAFEQYLDMLEKFTSLVDSLSNSWDDVVDSVDQMQGASCKNRF